MTPPVANMDQKVITVPQVEETAPPARRGGRVVWVAVAVVLAAVVIGGAVLGAVALHTSHRSKQTSQDFLLGVDYGDRRVAEHVTVDYQSRIVYINEERSGSLGGLHYLHNFDRRLTAIRDAVNNRCYITSQQGNFQKVVDWYSSQNGKTSPAGFRTFRFVPQPIDRDVVEAVGGKEMASHCRYLPAHWIIPHIKEVSLAPVRPAANKTVDFQCNNGGEFDPETSTCSHPPGQISHREKRQTRGINITITDYGNGTCVITCTFT